MGKAELGTAKYYSKQLKASGLQKLKFYCQLCAKQCRDANGFKNHLSSMSHQRKIESLNESGKGYHVVEEFSEEFRKEFLRLLKINHGTKKINANKFYQEYILTDRNHIHMNSTRWSSLTSFIRYLGSKGYIRVENLKPNSDSDSEFNLEILLVDSSSENKLKKKKLEKRNQTFKSDEEVSKRFIDKQMKLGKELAKDKEPQGIPEPIASQEPVKLTILQKQNKKLKIKNAFNYDDENED
ncbi:uncharacterized protein PRCAT00002040001 [Priceomyces carsonii]|uniref:uncharacterized protein n=1 Tax=Priceomyces carsonii TaxID=28549 RepID=UPI002EDB4174|nr:unnamed protein product [Priceomyces carsonii]